VEQQFQQLANAELQVALAARSLESTSGVQPDVSTVTPLSDDLHPEPELRRSRPGSPPSSGGGRFGEHSRGRPGDGRAAARVPALHRRTFTELGTNAPGFTGHNWYYQAALTFTWSLDLTNFADVRVQSAAADAARARELRTQLSPATPSTGNGTRWWPASLAAAPARRPRGCLPRRHAGAGAVSRRTITQLDLLQAQRDAFNAE